jgi:type II secretory pathway pseudopilin PulG
VAQGGPAPRASQGGFSLVAVAASITVMLLLMGMAMPTWKYVMRNAREEELIFRGTQIVEAIERYQKKHGNSPPVSLDVMVKGKFLRKAYKDPMTPKGEWRFIRPGEVQAPSAAGARRGRTGMGMATPAPTPTPRSGPGSRTGTSSATGTFGPFIGVASISKDKSIRLFNGRGRYSEWLFVVGQPRLVGKDIAVRTMPGVPRRDNPTPQR